MHDLDSVRDEVLLAIGEVRRVLDEENWRQVAAEAVQLDNMVELMLRTVVELDQGEALGRAYRGPLWKGALKANPGLGAEVDVEQLRHFHDSVNDVKHGATLPSQLGLPALCRGFNAVVTMANLLFGTTAEPFPLEGLGRASAGAEMESELQDATETVEIESYAVYALREAYEAYYDVVAEDISDRYEEFAGQPMGGPDAETDRDVPGMAEQFFRAVWGDDESGWDLARRGRLRAAQGMILQNSGAPSSVTTEAHARWPGSGDALTMVLLVGALSVISDLVWDVEPRQPD